MLCVFAQASLINDVRTAHDFGSLSISPSYAPHPLMFAPSTPSSAPPRPWDVFGHLDRYFPFVISPGLAPTRPRGARACSLDAGPALTTPRCCRTDYVVISVLMDMCGYELLRRNEIY